MLPDYRLGFDADEDVLFLTFGMTEGSSDQPSEALGSSICMYSMTSIRHEFLRAQKDCYSSKGRILKWINDEEPRCEFDVSVNLYSYPEFKKKTATNSPANLQLYICNQEMS